MKGSSFAIRVGIKTFTRRSMALAALIALAFSITYAQGGASITGIVTDASGGAIPAANVKVENTDTGAVRNISTDDGGRYDAPLLPVGNYSVTIEKSGFQQGDSDGNHFGGGAARSG